ncbi:MAG: DUF488 domain-containing protein [Candidatus Acidiferrales bacterium]|jgi:uncharacterized protein YeaO (DUF488 family)
MFKLKRIYVPAKPADGYRVLVDRIWPRGVSKEKAGIDLWMKEIAPSDHLRKWFSHDAKRWIEFQKRYREELRATAELTKQLRELEKTHRTVTLIYSARDERRNQAVVLCAFLQRST